MTLSADPSPSAEDVSTALRHLDLAIERWRSAFGQRYKLTVNDSLILSNLADAGGQMLPGELAKQLLLGTGSLTAMLDRLEAATFIRRQPNPRDRRSTIIEMTSAGERALSASREQVRLAIDDSIDADLQPAFAQSLMKLALAFDAVTGALLNGSG